LQQHIDEVLTEAADRFDPPGLGGLRLTSSAQMA
jgi:hypothetical protein